jgi:hypothetical protein
MIRSKHAGGGREIGGGGGEPGNIEVAVGIGGAGGSSIITVTAEERGVDQGGRAWNIGIEFSDEGVAGPERIGLVSADGKGEVVL